MRLASLVLLAGICSLTAAQPDQSAEALRQLSAAVEAKPKSLDELCQRPFAKVPLTKADAAIAREQLWKARAAMLREERAKEFGARILKEGNLAMPYDGRVFGKEPKEGYSLWISMHGGGGAPKQVNDSQWQNQKKLYALEEGIYVAPRAPTDTWNLWHQDHIDRMFARLIENFIIFKNIDPNRVYLLGYSAGGDGVYQLAPRMADRWAGAAMMAGHPNGVPVLSLRNVPFAIQVGGDDSGYDRNKVAKEYGELLDRLQKDDPKGYVHFTKIHEGMPHWMNLKDKIALPWMANYSRNPIPEKVVWKQSGTPHLQSYWLAVPPGEVNKESLIVAERNGQEVRVTKTEKATNVLIRLDDRMMDLDKPVTVTGSSGKKQTLTVNRTMDTMIRTLQARGDRNLMFDAEVTVPK